MNHLTTDTTPHALEPLLADFDTLSLAEIQAATLQDRVDTKYIMGLNQLYGVLPYLMDSYRILSIDDCRLHRYETLYFDTPAFTIYEQHHNGLASRYKVRARKYLTTDAAFFEVKHRTNQNRTIKSRLPIDDVSLRLTAPVAEFAHSCTPFDPSQLQPKLWNDYMRMTLVGKQHTERVTLDINLSYHWQTACATLPNVVIVEIKQAQLSRDSAFIQHMRRIGSRPLSYSKYTAGVYSLYDHVKVNNFKAQMRRVHQVMQGAAHHELAG